MTTTMIAVRNQREADLLVPRALTEPADLPLLLAVPLEGPLDLTDLDLGADRSLPKYYWTEMDDDESPPAVALNALTGLRWVRFGEDLPWGFARLEGVTCGGGEKPLHPAWVRDLLKQCQAAGVPFTFLGWGPWWPAWEFQSMNQWVNHAGRCIFPGDICLDSAGKQLERGADWGPAHYPVAIMKFMGVASGSELDGQVYDQVGDFLRQIRGEFR